MMMNHQVRHAEQQTGEGDNYSRDDAAAAGGGRDEGGGGRRSTVLEWLRLLLLFFQLLLLRVWETCKKSEQLLPITNPPPTAAAAAAAMTMEQSMNDTLKELSKAKYMVFSGLVAILCGLLSLDFGSSDSTSATRFLIRPCNYATVVGSLCIIASMALPFTLPPRLSWIANLLFFIAIGLLSICILLCSLFVHMSF